MNWWCLKGCCNSPVVMCNFASLSKALTVVLSKYLPLWHGKVVTITSGPLWLTSCRCWPDACALHPLWAQEDANVPLAQRIHALYTLTHGYKENTHTLCQHERVTIRTTCGLRRPLSDQSLRRRRSVRNSTQEIFWFLVDTWVSDKNIDHVQKKESKIMWSEDIFSFAVNVWPGAR